MDSRDMEAAVGQPYLRLEEKRSVLVFLSYADDTDEEIEVTLTWKVCELCDGRGKHVNPSIDSNGITRDEFDEDRDFSDAYLRGDYDVSCYRCAGRRVEPESSDPRWKAHLELWFQMRAERAVELRMGY